ncbi:sporulation protein YqfD [Anaeromicropila herbilytica]|uniref:Sporulation protein YqfD n=1 Tax=Anaeromicropila herbilytica TaxID=2785025 RepID=A0A7R7ELA0_9FIRM|nr:sporulation protein YqfD [Anaeromicropila herbilytica]BCN30572.1 sporulation protein YqfD [Anaeromicropila herbilytica]
MLIRLLKWFRGYLLVTIRGYSPERFINLCSSRNILIWNLRQVSGGYEFFISVKGFKSLRPIIKKTHTRPIIKKRYGLPFLLQRYKKRKFFALGILIFAIMIYSFSLFIWDIHIEGNYTHTTDELTAFLNKNNIHSGALKNNINCTNMEELIRKKYEDIGWVSVEMKGTRLIIKIVETNIPEVKKVVTKPSHIVATKDGIVTSIITRKGTPQVSKGSVVKKGDILVSGIIDVYGDGDLLIDTKVDIADADIILKTYYNYKNKFNMDYVDKVYTEKEKSSFVISLFNHRVALYKPFHYFDKYDTIEDQKDVKLGENFFLPFKYYNITYKEYVEENKTYTKEEALQIANKSLNLFIKKLEEKGDQIIENNVRISFKNNKCIASGKIIVNEKAVKYRTIKDSEWQKEEKEEPALE